jgi:hypothetical protein
MDKSPEPCVWKRVALARPGSGVTARQESNGNSFRVRPRSRPVVLRPGGASARPQRARRRAAGRSALAIGDRGLASAREG